MQVNCAERQKAAKIGGAPEPDCRPRPPAEIKANALMAWIRSGIPLRLSPNARPESCCDLPGSAAAT